MRVPRIAAIALAVAVVTGLGLSGCASTDSGATATITTNGAEPSRPLLTTDTDGLDGIRILDSLYAGLVYYDVDGSVQNDVAASISTDDNAAYTITIREGLSFSDGEPVTASSFVDAWNFGSQPSSAQANRSSFASILGVDPAGAADVDLVAAGGLAVVDDTTFVVRLSAPTVDFVQRLGGPAFYPLPTSAFDDLADFGQHPIGNGPYMLDGDDAWQHGEGIELVANPSYDGPREPQNGGVSVVFYASEAAAYADLLSGNLDVMSSIPDSALASLTGDLGDAAIVQPSAMLESITIPFRLTHFSGPEGELRRAAISRAIDRQDIIGDQLAGLNRPALDFASPIADGYRDDLAGVEVLDGDDDTAVDLWAQADQISPWTGSFAVAYDDSADAAWVDEVVAQIGAVLGIDATSVALESEEFRAQVDGGTIPSAFLTTTSAGSPSLVGYLAPVFASTGPSNRSGFSDADFDALIAEAAAASTLGDANAILQSAQTVLLDRLPAIPLWYGTTTGGFDDRLSDVGFDWRGVPQFFRIAES